MANSYDLIVIGTDSAASTAAYQCREARWRVAVVDHLPFGGTCALRGCLPKKIREAAQSEKSRKCSARKPNIPDGWSVSCHIPFEEWTPTKN